MPTDLEGFIKTPSRKPFQIEYQPLLAEVERQLLSEARLHVHSVYVYGSVAQGRAVPGKSDLDLSLILHQPASSEEHSLLESRKANIEAAYPLVTKVDFDIGTLQDLTSEKTALAWSYWLKHHCRCIAGEDLSAAISPYRPSLKLALAVNGDYDDVLQRYIVQIKASGSTSATKRLLREASRKAIRSTNILRTEDATDWPETLADHVERVARQFPGPYEDIRILLTCATDPELAPADFVLCLQRFMDWMKEVRH